MTRKGIVSETGRFDLLGLDDPMRLVRLGIMGGTFDPIHQGHLVCAEQAREQFSLEGVIFMPAGRPAFKQFHGVTDAEERLDMARLAIRGNDAFDVSRMEVDREGVTYTVDTLQTLHDHYPRNVSLYFITGTDAIWDIIAWREASRLAALASFVAATRPGYDKDVARAAHATSETTFDLNFFEVPALAISSTDLRARVQAGRSVRYLVPEAVDAYILSNSLYRGVSDADTRGVAASCAVPFRASACERIAPDDASAAEGDGIR
jgi:nicotinate-nucleotide adenylyltransferase